MYRRTTLLAFLAMILAAAPARAAQDAKDAIVKIYTIVDTPDYYNPWSMRGPRAGTGSGCIIKGKRILTNAHVVSDRTFLQVRRYGDAKRHQARVVSVSHEADLAILSVDDPDFFDNVQPLEFGDLPNSQDEVLVYGFPLGGDTLSITKGVISRIENQTYVHSSVNLLAGQIDAAINPGNSGGPVIKGGRIVGVVMQGLQQADNIGYMVPVSVAQHFFTDLEDGRYDGIPSLGLVMQDMENPDLKRKYGLGENQTGLLINKVLPGSPCAGQLQIGDVVAAVEGHPIADDGTVEFRPRERTGAGYFVQQHQVGEKLKLDVLSGGTSRNVSVELTRTVWKDWLVPMEQYDVLPSYYIYGGLVFCPLVKSLLQAWGPNWYQAAPNALTAYLTANVPEVEDEQVVMVLKVLPADVNQGYHDIGNWIVEEAEGQHIHNMKELIAAIEEDTTNAFVTLKSNSGQIIVLDRKNAERAAPEILATYRVIDDRSPDLK
ncbi:MAG: trypsin-like peptidase domain-containing protein [bacterium]